ncbi:hypothetical protein CL614_01535 [archaeon]|nr:hypothetical protein [archaeon]|tara:strand:- start:619 stop:1065 length:447 start_codon:yes stop_codon:yes gene_type:complete
MKKLIIFFLIIFTVGIAHAEVEISLEIPGEWTEHAGDNYATLSDGDSFFALASKSGSSTAESNVISITDDEMISLVVSSDTQKLVDKMPELRIQGFFSTAINFIVEPLYTEVFFYAHNFVASVSQYDKIDLLIRNDDGLVIKDAVKDR